MLNSHLNGTLHINIWQKHCLRQGQQNIFASCGDVLTPLTQNTKKLHYYTKIYDCFHIDFKNKDLEKNSYNSHTAPS